MGHKGSSRRASKPMKSCKALSLAARQAARHGQFDADSPSQ
ncbi:hypothetical protein PATSB16_29570 [Pandoraea thiooxydans]|nr:hypothetical protein PATSB16_29570 [Pandoraea thiooxydans]